jgi:uncharacterized protein
MSTISSPCMGLCTLDPAAQICLGCGRNLQEIAGWSGMTETDRRRIMAILPERLAAFRRLTLDGVPATP